MSASLHRLAHWFKSQCDGTWESDWGITLQTLDNPGWMLEVNLDGTPLYNVPFKHLKANRGKDDWIECAIQDHGRAGGDERGRVFVAAGGPGNLDEIVTVFCDWAEQSGAGRESRPASKRPSQPGKPPFNPPQRPPQSKGHHGRPQQQRGPQRGPNSSDRNSSGRNSGRNSGRDSGRRF